MDTLHEIDRLTAENAKLRAEVARLTAESAEGFADFLTTEGVLLDYGSDIGREPPEDALRRFRAALSEKA